MLRYLALDLVAVADARQRESQRRAAKPRRFRRGKARAHTTPVATLGPVVTVSSDAHRPVIAVEATLS